MSTAWIIVAGALAWWAIGVASFVLVWTSKYDLTTRDIPLVLFSGVEGPFAWPIGWFVLIREPRVKPLLRHRGP